MVGAWRYKEVMDRGIMGKPVEYKFEDTIIYGVEKYEEYLTHLYGNWRELPPLEKQKSHHDFLFCDLNKSYTDE